MLSGSDLHRLCFRKDVVIFTMTANEHTILGEEGYNKASILGVLVVAQDSVVQNSTGHGPDSPIITISPRFP